MNYINPVFKYNNPLFKEAFKKATCILTISVGQEVHEGNKFAATVELVNRSFAACTLLIDDSLQRHSMALDGSQNADFFYETSVLAGDLWLERNKQYYKNLSILQEIIRWDRWLKHPRYLEQQAQIKSLMAEDGTYQQSFESTVDEFLRRFYARLSENILDRERARSLCLDYLIEECSAFCLWTELKAEFEVYPNRRSLALQATFERFVQPLYPELLYAVSVKFKNRKQFRPQNFHEIKTRGEV